MSFDESSGPESSASSKKQSFKCKICKKFLATAKTLKQHEKDIHADAKCYPCKQCDYVTYREANLKRHLLSHTKEKPYKCSVCSFSCSLEQNLKQHMLAKHSEERPRHECSHPDCNFTTPNLRTLKTHMLIHTNEKPFKCSHCDFRSRTLKNIKVHERTNAKEHPFKCSQCPFASISSSGLKYHKTTKHSKEKSYVCGVCQKRYVVLSELKRHEESHTNEKNQQVKCPFCQNVCLDKFYLKLHINTHRKEKM